MGEQVPDLSDGRSQRERMLAGDLYIADDPELAAASIKAAQLTERFNNSDAADSEGRRAALADLLGSIGEATDVRPPLRCDYGWNTHIGARSFVNVGAVFLDVARIDLGEDVQVGPNVQFLTPTHPIDPALRLTKWEAAEPIVVGDNVWLGGGVIILPGVTIGENTVVGAGAVVTKDLPANVVAVGNPARVLRKI
jgi:maltose O-acetyltransferase